MIILGKLNKSEFCQFDSIQFLFFGTCFVMLSALSFAYHINVIIYKSFFIISSKSENVETVHDKIRSILIILWKRYTRQRVIKLPSV